MQLIDYSHSFLSVIPPFLALALAVVTRRVLLSLSIGILVGTAFLTGGNPANGLIHLKDMAEGLVRADGEWSLGKLKILIFLILLGIFTSLLTLSGSNQAFADWAKRHIKNRRGAKMLTACLVFVTFIDDYFHSLAVGAIARPVTDKFKVSRAKLAYILDSTAAPMCVLMPVSSWGASIIATLAGLLVTYKITGYTPMGTFVAMSLMNYYALFALIMVFVVAWFSFDIGSMARFEQAALNETHNETAVSDGIAGRVYALIIPVLTLIASTVAAMIYTGAQASETFSILGAFENTDVNTSLVFGGTCGVLAVVLCTLGTIKTADYPKAVWQGAKSMFGAIAILILAWLISTVVGEMHTGDYLSTLVADSIRPRLSARHPLPARQRDGVCHRHKLGNVRHYAADCRRHGSQSRTRADYPVYVRSNGGGGMRRPLLAHLRHDHPVVHRRTLQPHRSRYLATALCPDGCRRRRIGLPRIGSDKIRAVGLRHDRHCIGGADFSVER